MSFDSETLKKMFNLGYAMKKPLHVWRKREVVKLRYSEIVTDHRDGKCYIIVRTVVIRGFKKGRIVKAMLFMTGPKSPTPFKPEAIGIETIKGKKRSGADEINNIHIFSKEEIIWREEKKIPFKLN